MADQDVNSIGQKDEKGTTSSTISLIINLCFQLGL
jgi:hypothetical protein